MSWSTDIEVLQPKDSLDSRNNYRRQYYINRDGSIVERSRLYVTDKRLREKLIFIHFMQFFTKHITQDDVGFDINSRDNPWDFQIEASTGDKFNVEIVSIADNELQFITMSREENLDNVRDDEKIRLRYLKKLSRQFPDSETDQLVENYLKAGIEIDAMVDNPFHGQHKGIYVSTSEPRSLSMAEIIYNAVHSKTSKKNKNKEKTIIVIDNRTSVDVVSDVFDAINMNKEYYELTPFKEIWLYTGYCSDNDGNNSEYTMIGVKVSDYTKDRLASGIHDPK